MDPLERVRLTENSGKVKCVLTPDERGYKRRKQQQGKHSYAWRLTEPSKWQGRARPHPDYPAYLKFPKKWKEKRKRR